MAAAALVADAALVEVLAALVVVVFPEEVHLETGSWNKHILSEVECKDLEKKIREIESSKKNQIVICVVKAADKFPIARWRATFLLFLLLSLIVAILFPELSHVNFLFAQIVIFTMSFFSTKFPLIKKIGLRSVESEGMVYQRALQVFNHKKNDNTYKDLDVLVLLSHYEKQIEIIFDEQYQKTVSYETIKNILEAMEKNIRKNGTYQSLLNALEQIETHLPARTTSTSNEAPDHILWADFSE